MANENAVTAELLHKTLIPQLDEQVTFNRKVLPYVTLEGLLPPGIPEKASPQLRKIAQNSLSPWGLKIIMARVNRFEVSGIMDANGSNPQCWDLWKKWGMPRKETPLYFDTLPYGEANMELRMMPGNRTMPFNKSPMKFVASYGEDDFNDALNSDHPVIAMETNGKGLFKVWDAYNVSIWKKHEGSDRLRMESSQPHGGNGIVPIVRYINDINSDGESRGIIYPIRYKLDEVNKTKYDAAVVNNSNSWNKMWATGIESMDDVQQFEGETDQEFAARLGAMERRRRLEIGTSDILTSENNDAKFGSLSATNPSAFVPMLEFLLKELSSVSNTPADEITGTIQPQSAEQAANARELFRADINNNKSSYSYSHESLFNLHAHMTGSIPIDYNRKITWWDRDTGSVGAKVDALGKQASQLGVPKQVMWSELPNMTPEKLAVWLEAKAEEEKQAAALTEMIASMGNEDASQMTLDKDAALEEEVA